MSQKKLTEEMLQTVKSMLESGFKKSDIAAAVGCSLTTIYLIKSGKYEENIKKWREATTQKRAEQADPICSNNKCFAFIDECGSGKCIALNNTVFGNRKCPFFKTRERMDFEERKTNLRLEELGMRGATYE